MGLPEISAITAVLAVVIGPLVQLRIAKWQQRASVVSNNRVRWIEDFRRDIAQFIAATHLHEAERLYLQQAEESGDKKQVDHYYKATDVSFLQVNTLLHSIRLKLDPDSLEKRHDKEIWIRITNLDKLSVDDFRSLQEFEQAFNAEVEPLRRAVRAKLKVEWDEKVERLK